MPLILKSSKYGSIRVGNLVESACPESFVNTNDSNFSKIFVYEDDITEINDILPVITYLGGYCVRALLKRISCNECKSSLVIDKELEADSSYKLIFTLDRGALMYPHPDVVTVVTHNYIVIQKLLSEDFENYFLKHPSQRSLVSELTLSILMEKDFILDVEHCLEGHSSEMVIKSIIWNSTNTLLKNYCKLKNDDISYNKASKKRKLQTH